jgi:hypothetical protein
MPGFSFCWPMIILLADDWPMIILLADDVSILRSFDCCRQLRTLHIDVASVFPP